MQSSLQPRPHLDRGHEEIKDELASGYSYSYTLVELKINKKKKHKLYTHSIPCSRYPCQLVGYFIIVVSITKCVTKSKTFHKLKLIKINVTKYGSILMSVLAFSKISDRCFLISHNLCCSMFSPIYLWLQYLFYIN